MFSSYSKRTLSFFDITCSNKLISEGFLKWTKLSISIKPSAIPVNVILQKMKEHIFFVKSRTRWVHLQRLKKHSPKELELSGNLFGNQKGVTRARRTLTWWSIWQNFVSFLLLLRTNSLSSLPLFIIWSIRREGGRRALPLSSINYFLSSLPPTNQPELRNVTDMAVISV